MAESVIPKAVLWIGQHGAVARDVVAHLQNIYCKKNCSICATCKQIATKQFHEICWFNNDGETYKTDELSMIEEHISYIRENSVPYFFILDHAELLSVTCCNKLLKSLEDAPPGYHFILITNREAAILPTIRSRCFVYQNTDVTKNQVDKNSFVAFFSKDQLGDIPLFNELVERYKSGHESEILSECHELLQKLLIFYNEQKSEAQKKITLDRIEYVKNVVAKGIPSGSVPLILRAMYLRWKNEKHFQSDKYLVHCQL